MKILAVIDSPGGADFLAPVWSRLASEHECRLITVGPTASAALKEFAPTRCDTLAKAQKIYDEFGPDRLVTGVSSLIKGPYALNELVKYAAERGQTIIALQDYWANHRAPHNRAMINYWTKVCLPDELAKNYLLADGYRGAAVVTGHPGWEKCLAAAPAAADGEFVLLWAGSAAPGSEAADEESFRFLLAAVKSLNPRPALLVRAHPRDEAPARYERLAEEAGVTLRPPPTADTDALLPRADVVLATYSTSLIHAALGKIAAVSVMLPDAGLAKMKSIGLPDFPLNQLGAAIGVYENDPNILTQILIKLRDDAAYRATLRAKQEQFAASLGRDAATRVAAAITAA